MSQAADYDNVPMSREESSDIMITFGLLTHGKVPIRRRMSANQAGYDAIIPMEWIAELPAIKRELNLLGRWPRPTPPAA